MQNYLLFKQTGLRRKMFHRSKLHLFLLDNIYVLISYIQHATQTTKEC